MDCTFTQQVNFILQRGEGIKACLFDPETKQIISNLIPLSLFQDNDFFYFDYLSNNNRKKVEGMTCVVILRPSNLKMLLEEITCPSYSKYIVLFTSQIDPFTLEIMANSDIHSVISEVHEINIDLYRQSHNLYVTNSTKHKRAIEAILSLLLTKEISPSLLYTDEYLAREIQSKISCYNFAKKGTLILLKRNFDLITPLIYDWHYQSMIYEHLDVDNSVVKINNREFVLNDQFFVENKFKKISEVGGAIQLLIEDIDKKRIGVEDFDVIQDILQQKATAEMHLSIYNKIVEEALMMQDPSEVQHDVLTNKEVDIEKLIESIQGNPLVILLVYFLRHVKNWEESSKLFPKYRADLMRFHDVFKPQNYCYKHRFDGNLDVKLGYISPLCRIVKHVIQNRIKEGAFFRFGAVERVDPIIIYIEGGVTMREYREMMQISEVFNVDVIVVSDEVLNIRRFLNESKQILL